MLPRNASAIAHSLDRKSVASFPSPDLVFVLDFLRVPFVIVFGSSFYRRHSTFLRKTEGFLIANIRCFFRDTALDSGSTMNLCEFIKANDSSVPEKIV